MPIADWTTSPDWDTLYVGGKPIECAVVRVTVKLPSGLDIKKGKGKKKATITDDGDPPAEVDIEIELLPKHLPKFVQEIVPILRPQAKGASRPPLEIGHPNTRLWNINVITPGEISSPMPTSGGTWVISIKAHEWCPAPSTVKKKSANEKPKTEDEQWAHLRGGVTNFIREALNREGPPPPPDQLSPQEQAQAQAFNENLRAMPSALLGLIKPSKRAADNL
jgi:hypothetical protein